MLSAEEIRQLRQDTGLSVIQFAQLFGVAPSTVTHWETDRSSPPLLVQTAMIELRRRIEDIKQMESMNRIHTAVDVAITDTVKKTLLGLLLGGGLVAFMSWLYTRNRE